jgi:hypothetical protein
MTESIAFIPAPDYCAAGGCFFRRSGARWNKSAGPPHTIGMKLVFLLFALSGIAAETPARVPVLLELFTSEGCSSCPPADRLLEKLDKTQPVPGAELIVLSEHVDYWNQLGWKDPFSSEQYTSRQHDYAESLGGEVYTPELVVDGAKGFVGSSEGDTRSAVAAALRTAKAPIQVAARRDGNKAKVTLHLEAPVEGTLYLALAHDAMRSQVTRGENSGRALSHVAVVYSLEKVAKLGRREVAFDREISVNAKPGETTRIVAFVEKPEVGRVVALGQARL